MRLSEHGFENGGMVLKVKRKPIGIIMHGQKSTNPFTAGAA